MTREKQHPSRLVLDRVLARTLDDPDGEIGRHIESCERCRQRLKSIERAHRQFLETYPNEEALSKEAPESQASRTSSPGWRWALGGSAAVAAATLLILFLAPKPPTDKPSGIREKGGTVVELAIRRGSRQFDYRGQKLQGGDVLAFRYTTKRRYLILLSLEASGKVQIFLPRKSEHSIPIKAGKGIALKQGIALDLYPGPERILALFSDRAISVKKLRLVVKARYKALKSGGIERLSIGRLPVKGDQVSWLIRKAH